MSYIKEFNINDLTNCFKMSVDMQGIKKVEGYISNLEQENEELKKQLEEEKNKVREYSYKLCNYRCEETYENQQKEFIKFLEDKINFYKINTQGYSMNLIENVLSKYKEIIERN